MIKVIGADPLQIRPGQTVAIDTETTGLEWWNKLTGISLAWKEGQEVKFCHLIPEDPDRLFNPEGVYIPDYLIRRLFMQNETVFHNLPFDYRVLFHHFRLDPPNLAHDTLYLAKLVEYQMFLSLEWLYKKYVGDPPQWWIDIKPMRKQMTKVKQEDIYRYGCFDAYATLLLFEKLMEQMHRSPETSGAATYSRDLDFTRLVMKMIQRGIPLNRPALKAKGHEFELRMAEIVKELKPTGIKNPNSGDQVGKYVADNFGIEGMTLTKTGRVSVDVESLERFSGEPVIQRVIEYKQLAKGISSWVEPLLHMAQDDGLIHSTLSPFGTRSFRMSSSQINMQAVPMKKRDTAFGERAFGSFMGIFKSPDPDEQLWQPDVKQAEFRMAAMLSRENNLAQMFTSGGDPYIAMAIRAWKDPTRRNDAKRAALATIYEIGIQHFAATNKVTIKEAENILYGFRNMFPKIQEASKYYEAYLLNHGYAPLFDGRRRYIGHDEEPYKAFNQRVQGGVAISMEVAMLELERLHPGRQILQTHDSLVLYLPASEQEREPIVRDLQQIIQESVPAKVKAMTTPEIPYIIDVELWE